MDANRKSWATLLSIAIGELGLAKARHADLNLDVGDPKTGMKKMLTTHVAQGLAVDR
jgi:hypothetical protein